MHIQAAEVDGVTVLSLRGDLDEVTCEHIRNIAAGLLEQGHSPLVMDLSGVQRMYTAGIFALFDLQGAAETIGRRVIWCGARPYIRELLRISMLDQVLNLEADVESAVDITREAS